MKDFQALAIDLNRVKIEKNLEKSKILKNLQQNLMK